MMNQLKFKQVTDHQSIQISPRPKFLNFRTYGMI